MACKAGRKLFVSVLERLISRPCYSLSNFISPPPQIWMTWSVISPAECASLYLLSPAADEKLVGGGGGPPPWEEGSGSGRAAMAREPTKPTDASACAPVPAIDVAIIGPQKAPLLGTHARSDPRIGIPSGSETRSKRP